MTDPESGLTGRLSELHSSLAKQNPILLAQRAGGKWHKYNDSLDLNSHFRGVIHLPLWKRQVVITYPDFTSSWLDTNQPLGILEQGLLAYYLTLTDGTPTIGQWISFTELPDGRFYTQAFQGYTGAILAQTYDDNLAAFERAAAQCGGLPENLGDIAFSFSALPRVPVLAVAWLGDEDFPTGYQVLFDVTAPHHLTTDGCAILGSALVKRLLKCT